MTDCAICHETHDEFVRTMADGSSHVYQDAETFRRRSAATIAHKIKVNELLGAPTTNLRKAHAELTK